jgi:hypothetical protein
MGYYYKPKEEYRLEVTCRTAKLIADVSPMSQTMQDLYDVVSDAMSQTSELGFYQKVTEIFCQQHSLKLREDLECTEKTNYTGLGNNDSLIKTIDENFNRSKPIPTGVSYCSTGLQNGNNINNYKVNRKLGIGLLDSDCGAHASVIIGRRKGPGGKCQFLLQNTWSNATTNSYECEPRNDPGCMKAWVDADYLNELVFGVEYIEPKS